MASSSEEEEILEAAVAGIPRVAEAVASIPEEARVKALTAVESTYRQTMLDLGYEEGPAKSWVSAMMLRLQTQVEEQVGANGKLLMALHEEPVGLVTVTSESALAPSDDASAETIEKDIEQVVLKTYRSNTQRDTLRDEAPAKAETDEQSA